MYFKFNFNILLPDFVAVSARRSSEQENLYKNKLNFNKKGLREMLLPPALSYTVIQLEKLSIFMLQRVTISFITLNTCSILLLIWENSANIDYNCIL